MPGVSSLTLGNKRMGMKIMMPLQLGITGCSFVLIVRREVVILSVPVKYTKLFTQDVPTIPFKVPKISSITLVHKQGYSMVTQKIAYRTRRYNQKRDRHVVVLSLSNIRRFALQKLWLPVVLIRCTFSVTSPYKRRRFCPYLSPWLHNHARCSSNMQISRRHIRLYPRTCKSQGGIYNRCSRQHW